MDRWGLQALLFSHTSCPPHERVAEACYLNRGSTNEYNRGHWRQACALHGDPPMSHSVRLAVGLAVAFLAWTGPVVADPPGLTTLAIGAAAPDFTLPGVDG